MHWETRFAVAAKNALLIGSCRSGVQHPPTRFSTMTANFGHMVPISTDYLATFAAGEPRFIRAPFMRGSLGMRRTTTLTCNFALSFAIHRCEAALALARSRHFYSYGSGLFQQRFTVSTPLSRETHPCPPRTFSTLSLGGSNAQESA
jgi:hypothetical protein